MREHPISKWMRAHGIKSQVEAAPLLGLTQQQISDYVTWSHTPRPATLRRIAERIGCSPASLIPDTPAEEGAA